MNIRKIAVLGAFGAGAALALAPLAAADTDPLADTVAAEIASMNSLFSFDATLAGVGNDVVTHTGTFDTIPLADAPQTAPFTTLDYLLYGLNPAGAGPASDPGAYSVFNGAMVPLDDSYNSLVHAMLNGGDPLTWASGDLFGGASAEAIANATSGWTEAADYFNLAVGDLLGYLGIFLPAA